MAGVAGDEDPWEAFLRRVFRQVVELVAEPLADLIHRPPRDLLHVQGIGTKNALRRGDQMIARDLEVRDPLVLGELVELDIDAEQISAEVVSQPIPPRPLIP